jgi:hypothetical protein
MDLSRIETALLEPSVSELSDRFLAEYLGVRHWLVAKTRKRLESLGAIPVTTMRACVDGVVRDVARIGRATAGRRCGV